jgi:glutathione peroxidase
MTAALYDIPLRRLDGSAATLAEFSGQVLLIVNVASKCGLTPQYTGLEALYEQLQAQGLQVLGFPCNDFAGQEPGAAEDIQSFCTLNYGVKFPMFDKVSINAAPRHPLYAALIAAQPQAQASGDSKFPNLLAQHNLLPAQPSDVMWNFEKFLVGRNGQVVGRFAPDVAPDSPALRAAIDAALAA